MDELTATKRREAQATRDIELAAAQEERQVREEEVSNLSLGRQSALAASNRSQIELAEWLGYQLTQININPSTLRKQQSNKSANSSDALCEIQQCVSDAQILVQEVARAVADYRDSSDLSGGGALLLVLLGSAVIALAIVALVHGL
jgi:hypothetical protein